MSNEGKKLEAQMLMALLTCLEKPPHDISPVQNVVAKRNPFWALAATTDFVVALMEGDNHQWAKLLSHLTDSRRHIRSGDEGIDLFARFKALSPFADAELFFDPSGGGQAETFEGLLRSQRLSSEFDEFAYVRRGSVVGIIWLRAKHGSPLWDVRDGPLIVGEELNMFV